MTDLKRMLVEIQGLGARMEANAETTEYWMQMAAIGHPKAQDFEPTGRSHSDPTARNGIVKDRADQHQKKRREHIERAAREMRAAADIDAIYAAAEARPDDDDIDDIWCHMHLRFGVSYPKHKLGLCRPCYERRRALMERGLELTAAEVEHHAHSHNGRWPKRLVDPSQPGSLVLMTQKS